MKELSAPPTPNSAHGGALTRPKSSRILRTAEFRTVYDNGIRLSGPLFVAFCLASKGPGRTSARLGLTVPRAVGKAVVRNRIKRRIREMFRLHRAEIGIQWDVVINPRKTVATVPWEQVERAFRKVIEKCAPSS